MVILLFPSSIYEQKDFFNEFITQDTSRLLKKWKKDALSANSDFFGDLSE